MGVSNLSGMASPVLIGLSLLLSGCASAHPRVADETKVEEWARCGHSAPVRFIILCLETRRPL